jgi:sterol desaturase/sphingolipid hydroxylase (fatty acid hydroxylase superfamily)
MFSILLQLCGGWVYGHFFEYAVHRWVLHGPMRKKGRLLSFHFTQHHKNAKQNRFEDSSYDKPFERGNCANKELISLGLVAALHVPLVFYLPWLFAMSTCSLVSYYYHHYKSHTNPKWGKSKLPWHYDHHMGRNQNLNFGVRSSFFDKMLGTHEDYSKEKKEKFESLLRLKARIEKRKKK